MSRLIKLSENISVIETEYYIFGRKIRRKRIIFTRKYESELRKKFQEYLSCLGQNKGKENGE